MNNSPDIQRRRGLEVLDLTGYASHEPVWMLSDGTYVVGATRLNSLVAAWMIGTVAEVRIIQNVLAREYAIKRQIAAARTLAEHHHSDPDTSTST